MISTDEYIRRLMREIAKRYLRWDERFKKLEQENAKLREALESLERLSGIPMKTDDPARVKAREALKEKV